jgi:hypothetical protein
MKRWAEVSCDRVAAGLRACPVGGKIENRRRGRLLLR